MFTLIFLRATVERALKTAAQSVLTVYFVGDVVLDVFATDWQALLGVAAGGAFFSVLTSIGSDALTGNGPSLTNAEVVVAKAQPAELLDDVDEHEGHDAA